MLLGNQEPRVKCWPASGVVFDAADSALDWSVVAGRELMPWQELVVRQGMAQQRDASWAAFEVGVEVSRQNGKNGSIEAVELAWMIDEPGISILHTAHDFQTALESMAKLEDLFRANPLLEEEHDPKPRYGNGKESIRLNNGSVIRFRTRTKSGGRGFSVDRLVIDEAMILSSASLAALMPLLTTAPNPQIWYLGSAADVEAHQSDCVKWHSLRKRALSDNPGSLCWLEWSAPECPTDASDEERTEWREDRANWAAANPALGYLLTERYIIDELAAFSDALDQWEVERLSVGRWPTDVGSAAAHVPEIDLEVWGQLVDRSPVRAGHFVLAVEATPDEQFASIAQGVKTATGVHAQVIYHGPFDRAEVVSRIRAVKARETPTAVLLDPKSAAGAFQIPLEDAGIEVTSMTLTHVKEACRDFLVQVREGKATHDDDPRLVSALEQARLREFSDGSKAWERHSGEVSQLVALTHATWGVSAFKPQVVNAAPLKSVPAVPVGSGASWQSMSF